MALPGNPRGKTFRCGCSGSEADRRRAIGVVAVLQSSAARPRRWCDAGPPKADQKVGPPGSHGGGSRSSRPRAWIYERDPDMAPSSRLPEIAPSNDDGPATCQARPGAPSQHRFETARPVNANPTCSRENAGNPSPGRARATSGSADIWRPTGACRARHCAGTTFRLRGTIHTMALPGNPRGRAFQCSCSGDDAGRRRSIGEVAVTQSTLSRPRRWCDAREPPTGRRLRRPALRDITPREPFPCDGTTLELSPRLPIRPRPRHR